MEAALLELQSPGEHKIARVARKHGVTRQAIHRRLSGKCGTREKANEQQRLLKDPEELEIIKDVKRQCELCLPPSSKMVVNIATEICGKEPNRTWITDFVRRHRDKLDSRYLATLDLARNKADAGPAYQTYFDAVQQAMERYNIKPENVYNMAEKGLILAHDQETKRIFNKDIYKDNKSMIARQDDKRDWIAVVATICANGSTLSPYLISKADSGTFKTRGYKDLTLQAINAVSALLQTAGAQMSMGIHG